MKLLITAGPTREPIDAVRFIGNRSSGAVGIALAQAAVDAGHTVTLLLGPVGAPPKASAALRIAHFTTTADLEALLREHLPRADMLVMAAAVADYRPARVHDGKLPRGDSADQTLTLHLEPTPDLLAQCAEHKHADQKLIAFALEEPAQLDERAQRKLRAKGADAIVANPIATMETDRITPLWLTADGEREAPGQMTKTAFAQWLLPRLAQL